MPFTGLRHLNKRIRTLMLQSNVTFTLGLLTPEKVVFPFARVILLFYNGTIAL